MARVQRLVAGHAAGPVEASLEPVSVARIDAATGILHEPGHPLDGRSLAGKVLACPGGKGSSSGSYVLLSLARRGLAPAAIVVQQADAVLVAGAVLADIPLLQGIDPRSLRQGDRFSTADVEASPATGIILDAGQREALDGGRGKAWQFAMRILVAAGEACGADALIPVASAHVGLSLYSLGEAGVELLEMLAADGARFAVPATTNVLSFERGEVGGAQARLQQRALDALLAMGASSSCSCNPFVQGFSPGRGQAVAWSESATAPYVNGALGARTNREGATALASALCGFTPRYGMHLDSARAAGPLYRVEARLDSLARFHLLGAAVGRRCADAVPALVGLRGPISRDALYAFSASLAAHSTATMFHAVGITPEAPDLAALYPVGVPEATLIGEAELAAEQARWAGDASPPDYVVVGCPHASLEQLQEVAALVEGATVRDGTVFLLHTNRDMKEAAVRSGAAAVLSRAGIRVTSDTCAYVSLSSYVAGSRILTDSAKMAFLMATRGLRPEVASLPECVRAALSS